jgi:hypothetical protein
MSSQSIIPHVNLNSNTDSGYIVSASSNTLPYTYRGYTPFTTSTFTNGWISSPEKYDSNLPIPTNYVKSEWNINSSNNFAWANPAEFTRNGSPDENSIERLMNPYGIMSDVWVCKNKDVEGADGGWNVTFPVSDTKNYVSIIYVKRVSDSTSGRFYHGCHPDNTSNVSSGLPVPNPYFTNYSGGALLESLPKDEWCVSIGFIYAKNSTVTTDNPNGGIYVVTGPNAGKKLDTGVQKSYKMLSGATKQRHRTYLYYSSVIDTSILLWGAGFYEWNPSEEFNINSITIPINNGIKSTTYTGTSKINDISGEYLTIKLPKKMKLSSVNIQNRNDDLYRGDPFTVYIYGKNDSDTSWTQIGYKTNLRHGKMITNSIEATTNSFYNNYAFLVKDIVFFMRKYVSINKITLTGLIEDTSTIVTIPDKNLLEFMTPFNYSDPDVIYKAVVPTTSGSILPGQYDISDSSHYYDTPYEPYNAFDDNVYLYWASTGQYNIDRNSSTYGLYIPTSSTPARINNRMGDYIILETPIKDRLTGYRITNRNIDTGTFPSTVHLFGSNDRNIWTELDTKTDLIPGNNIVNPSNSSWFSISNTTNSYKIFALLVSKITSADTISKNVMINKIEYVGIPDISSYVPIGVGSSTSYMPSSSRSSMPSSTLTSTSSSYIPPGVSKSDNTPKDTEDTEDTNKLSSGAIAGIAIGVFIFILIIVILYFAYSRRNK